MYWANKSLTAFFADLNLPQLPEDREDLDAPLGVEEIFQVVNNTPSNKSPGVDGLPAVFSVNFRSLVSIQCAVQDSSSSTIAL